MKGNFVKLLLGFSENLWCSAEGSLRLLSPSFQDGSLMGPQRRGWCKDDMGTPPQGEVCVLLSHSDVEACASALESSSMSWSKGAIDNSSCALSPPSCFGPALRYVACLELAASMCPVGFIAITGFSGLFPWLA